MKANLCGELCRSLLPIVSLVCTVFGSASVADGQEALPAVRVPPSFQHPSGCPVPVRLPVVPLREPRPGVGVGPDQQWQTSRELGVAPTASFIESLQGNDAVVEVILGQGRLLTLKADIADKRGRAVIALADPSLVEFEMLPSPRLVRLIGRRAGITDLSITTADDQTYSFEVHVVYDLDLLRTQLRQVFPDAQLRITQMREHLALEGEARSMRQVDQILEVVKAYLKSVQPPAATASAVAGAGTSPGTAPPPTMVGRRGRDSDLPTTDDSAPDAAGDQPGNVPSPNVRGQGTAAPQAGGGANTTTVVAGPQVLNLLRVPGLHQVMLQVRIAELDRTSLREISAGLTGGGPAGSPFGVFPSGDFDLWVKSLRRNGLLTVLAEPNLVAMSGQHASFLSGGEIPIPTAQPNAGAVPSTTAEFKTYGVSLDFLPYVLDDERVRLIVSPEVSSLDYAVAIDINGSQVPGLIVRKTTTTVEMRQGQTLAIAGILQVETNATTDRWPYLGDIPYLGTFFSTNSHKRSEKELLVLVTPYLVASMDPDQVPPLPGAEIKDPSDLEFYLLHRLEGRTGREFNATHGADDALNLVRQLRLEQKSVCGPVGLSSSE